MHNLFKIELKMTDFVRKLLVACQKTPKKHLNRDFFERKPLGIV